MKILCKVLLVFLEYQVHINKKAIAEFWDVVQAWLGVLAKDNITAYDVMESYPKHLEKLKRRPRD